MVDDREFQEKRDADVARLHRVSVAHNLNMTDEELYQAYANYSAKEYFAGWMIMDEMTDDELLGAIKKGRN